VVRSVSTRPREGSGTLEVSYTWRVGGPGRAAPKEWRANIVFHLYTRPELESLLSRHGFEILEYWGSFRREAFGGDSSDQVVLCRRREE